MFPSRANGSGSYFKNDDSILKFKLRENWKKKGASGFPIDKSFGKECVGVRYNETK